MTHNNNNTFRRFLATIIAGSAGAFALAVAPLQASAKPMTQAPTTITGRLVDARTRQPLAGVRVMSYSYADGSRAIGVSDAGGHFSLNRVNGDEFAVYVARSERHCGGTVKVLGIAGAPLDAIATRQENANTFTAGDRGTIGVYRHGSSHCPQPRA